MKTKKLILCLVLVVGISAIAIVAGFFAGNAISYSLRNKPDYNFDVSAYTETISDIAYSSKDLPTERKASDAFIIASYVLNEQPNYKISGIGTVSTGYGSIGSMSLWGSAEKENNSIHTSIVAYNKMIKKYQVGLKYDYNILLDNIDFYYGTSHSDGSADWKAPQTMTSAEYEAEWGLAPTNFFTYTISSKTALSNKKPTQKIQNGKTVFEYSLVLDPKLSVSNYAKQLNKMSELDNYPDFSFVEFSFIVDENFVLQSVSIHEKYSVYIYGVLANCDAHIDYTFTY